MNGMNFVINEFIKAEIACIGDDKNFGGKLSTNYVREVCLTHRVQKETYEKILRESYGFVDSSIADLIRCAKDNFSAAERASANVFLVMQSSKKYGFCKGDFYVANRRINDDFVLRVGETDVVLPYGKLLRYGRFVL